MRHVSTPSLNPYPTQWVGQQIELRARRRNGEIFDAELSIGQIKAAGLVCTLRDITERKRTQNALAEERNLLRTLIDAVPDSIYVKDRQHRFLLRNSALRHVLGHLQPEGFVGKTDFDLFPTALAEKFFVVEEELFRTGQPIVDQEQQLFTQDGSTAWISVTKVPLRNLSGEIIGLAGISHDITERKQTAEVLREQRDFLHLVINSVPDLITVNDRTGYFHIVNERAAQIYGLTSADLVGKTDAEVNHNPGEVAFFLQTDQTALDSEQAVFIAEQTIQGRDYQTTKIPLRHSAGQPDRLLVVSSDITERKAAEAVLQQAVQKEKELNELKSRFVSMASHEFRTPLTSILLLTETLIFYRQKLTDEQVAQRLENIREQVGYLKDITEDVLQLAHTQTLRGEISSTWLDLDALCRSIIGEFQERPDISQRLLYSCDDDLHAVKLDKKLMRQIISNLISNATKYSLENTAIHIRLAYSEETLVLQVRDEGIGIPEADLRHLFQPFQRAVNVGDISGTGLGLAIAKEAVELHGGTISVESQIDVGTTFTVTIPAANNRQKNNDET